MGQSVRGSSTSTGGLRGLPAPARRPPHPFAILNLSCRAVFCARAKPRGVRTALPLNIQLTPRPGAAPQKSCHCAAMWPGKTARSADEPLRHCCLPGLIVKSLNQRFHPDERAGRIILPPDCSASTYQGGLPAPAGGLLLNPPGTSHATARQCRSEYPHQAKPGRTRAPSLPRDIGGTLHQGQLCPQLARQLTQSLPMPALEGIARRACFALTGARAGALLPRLPLTDQLGLSLPALRRPGSCHAGAPIVRSDRFGFLPRPRAGRC